MTTEQQLFEKRKYLKKTQVIAAAHKQYAFYLDKLNLRQVSTKLHQELYLLKIQQAI